MRWPTPLQRVAARHGGALVRAMTLGLGLLSAVGCGGQGAPPPQAPAKLLFADHFQQPDGLITNEYAFFNPSKPDAVKSVDWQVSSGSFFVRGATGWSGAPDDIVPNATSSNGTDSAVFRMVTASAYGDASVQLSLLNNGLTTTSRTPAQPWDGVTLWVRHASEAQLYAVTVNRRDNTAVIKKKVPGGTVNGGTYYDLTKAVGYTPSVGQWQSLRVDTRNNPDGSVTLTLSADGHPMVTATDRGANGAPYTEPGRVGIRGDNCDFQVKDFVITSL